MDDCFLFCDGSVHGQSKTGYGAYLVVPDLTVSVDVAKSDIRINRFDNTSSTALELQALLWALGEIQPQTRPLIVYTDSQNIVGLPARRTRLEEHDFRSRGNKRLNHYKLYQQFYQKMDQIDCRFIKVRGHLPLVEKGKIDQLFTLVDRAARDALRSELSNIL